MADLTAVLGRPSERNAPPVLQWLARSRVMAPVWTAMRVWLGIMWIQAGDAKLWGADNPAFMHNGGAGVAGFATHGTSAYTWWHSFLTGFVVPNAGWIGVLVAVAEFAVGIGLVLGLFTRLAALGSLALLFTYVMSGTASVCAFYALFAIVILATWRTSGWLGADGLIAGYRARRHDIRRGHRDDQDRQDRQDGQAAREDEAGEVREPAQNIGARAPATTPVSASDAGAAPAPVILAAPSPSTNGTGDLDPGPAVTSGGGRTQ
jgi:thiosulfate dehydrogenase (quinone) large subunit